MKRRVLIAALAVVLAVLGAGAVLAYVHQSVDSALAGQRGTTALVAQQAIPSGTSLHVAMSAGLLKSETEPVSAVSAEAVRSTAGLAGLVVSTRLSQGTVLLRPMLVPPAQVTGGVALPSGMVAVTLAFCLPEAVAGDVRPGAMVEIFNTTAGPGAPGSGSALTAGADCSGSHQQQGGGAARTQVLMRQVRVLSVGPATSGTTSGGAAATSTALTTSQGTMLVTFAVSRAAAQRLIQVSVTGLPYLALLQP